MPSSRALAVAATLLLALPTLAGCATQEETEPGGVVATFYPLGYVARRIAEEDLPVTTLVPDGVEPHDWEPSTATVLAVGAAQVIVRNGESLDPWLDAMIRESGSKAIVVDASRVLAETDAGTNVSKDPHYWLDPVAFQVVIAEIGVALGKADPENAAEYRARASGLQGEMDALHFDYSRELKECRIREIITTHDAFGYLAERYDFEARGVTGVSDDEEPSAGRVQEIIEYAKGANITVVYHERLGSPRTAEAIAAELPGGRTLPLDPIEGIPSEEQAKGMDYFALAHLNLMSLREGMGCA